MKLSTSILFTAGVYADYACCAYNDFGIRDPDCAFTERTAWGDDGGNEQVGLTQHACKAWEANTDATQEGSMAPASYNWGGCGFQRLFPWDSSLQVNANVGTSANFGSFEVDADGNGAMDGTDMFDHADGSGENSFMPYGRVALNGVCKLFIPAHHDDIQYVSIAGVHMRGNGYAAVDDCPGGNELGCSVMDASIADSAGVTRTGTAYCFAVSNDAEGFTNTNNIMNGNIAGSSAATHDSVTQPAHDPLGFGHSDTVTDLQLEFETNNQVWPDMEIWPGYSNPDTTTPPNGEDNSNVIGNNFDVVVHMKSTWCQSHWTAVDMQDTHTVGGSTYTEAGFGGDIDYPVYAQDRDDWPGSNTDFVHAHHDAMDKRFEAGICGLQSHTSIFGDVTVPDCVGDHAGFNYKTTTGVNKWPNAGAWLGHFSHVFCTGDTATTHPYLIYHDEAGADPTGHNILLSNFNNDFRRLDGDGNAETVTVRGNFRQAGSLIQYCSPGHLPDSTQTQSCTWNWNFDNAHLGNNAFQDPDFLGTGSQARDFQAPGWLGVQTNVRNFAITFNHGNIDLGGGADAAFYVPGLNAGADSFSCDGGSDYCTAAQGAAFNQLDLTLQCLPGGGSTGVAAKDDFPTCFMGDEVHFEMRWLGGSATPDYEQLNYISSWYSQVVES